MILDTFYLLFKTDVNAGAKQDIASLDAQIEQLRAKGKKRSDEEKMALAGALKQRKELTEQLKDQTRQTEKLGDSFVKAIEGGAQALASFGSFAALKSGILDAQKMADNLEILKQATHQNGVEIQMYGNMFEGAGSSVQAFDSMLYSVYQQASQLGIPMRSIGDAFKYINRSIQGLPEQNKAMVLSRFGITDPAQVALFEKAPEEFDRLAEAQRRNAEALNASGPAAREFGLQWANMTQALQASFATVNTDILPALSGFLQKLTEFFSYLRDNKGEAEAFFGSLLVLVPLVTRELFQFVRSLFAVTQVETFGLAIKGLAAAFTTLSLAIADAVLAYQIFKGISDAVTGKRDSALGQGADYLADKINNWWEGTHYNKGNVPGDAYRAAGKRNGTSKRSDSSIGPQSIEGQSYAFWLAQGYSPAQAAALVGNQKGEGWLGPQSVGDGGTAFGIAQWHQDRVNDILQNTGIDVRTAPLADQLKAQAWEMKNRFNITPQSLPNDTTGGTDFLVRHYEFSGNQSLDAMKRAGYAAQIGRTQINSVPSLPAIVGGGSEVGGAGDRNVTLKTGDITIHTQATDAAGVAGALHNELRNQYRMTISAYDDGVQA